MKSCIFKLDSRLLVLAIGLESLCYDFMIDIASRVYNHNWKIDPIVRSLLDIDFYKLLMAQFVLRNAPDVSVKFSVLNRSSKTLLADIIDEEELREQLDHIRDLSLSKGESTWLRGNLFYGKRAIFRPSFIDWLEKLKLPEYEIRKKDGQFEISFEGPWAEVMFWEVPVLSVLTELRSKAVLKNMGRFELQVLYARAMTKLWEKIEQLKPYDNIRIADFGTRRRHSFLWQDWCVQAMCEGMGPKFIGTSNCLIAMRRELEAIGTNAHELPMIFSALAKTQTELKQAPYKVLEDWHEEHDGNLRVILPDTYGTKNFLENAPDWLASWTGIRIDSGDPEIGAQYAINWWQNKGEDTKEKLIIFSDALDTKKIIELYHKFNHKVQIGFGWGTLLTNDFRGLIGNGALDPFSLVCKAVSANGQPTVKLSDNSNKAMGPQNKIEQYKKAFGLSEQSKEALIV